jgi:hypothetical protein|tara:strand:- start:9975 stop:10493 length:519 start_codon:yes stop_codon:yes gene_type:complete
MTINYKANVFDKSKSVNSADVDVIRSIATSIIDKKHKEYNIGIECVYCWHESMNDLRIWALIKNRNNNISSAIISSSMIECLYPAIFKMVDKINDLKDLNCVFYGSFNKISYNQSKYLFSNKFDKDQDFLLFENILFSNEEKINTNALVTINVYKKNYSLDYFHVSKNCKHK